MAQRPVVWFTICWVAGSSASAGLTGEGAVLGAAALAAFLLGMLVLRLLPWRIAAVCMIAYALAAGSRGWADAANLSGLPDLLEAAEADATLAFPVELAATIIQPVTVDGDRARFRLETEWLRLGDETESRLLRERLQIQVKLAEQAEQEIAAAWRRGDRISVSGELKLPAPASNFDGFDYRRYLHSHRIHWLLQVDGAAAVAAEPGDVWRWSYWLGRIDAVRQQLGARLDAIYPEQHAGYMKGLVLGMREDLDAERFQQFSELGLTHILAISGLHVAVFLYGLHIMLGWFRLSRETVMNLMIAAVPFYVLLSGASPSVVRAGIMAMIGLMAAKLGMLKDGLHLLCAAAWLMLAADPYMLGNISYQMSVIVTAGLIVGVRPLRACMPVWQRGNPLLDLIAVSVAAQLASFPLTVYYFNQFNLISLPANILLVPFISSIVMPIGAVSLVLTAVWQPAAEAAAVVARLGNELTFMLTDYMNQPYVLRSIWPSPPLWWLLAWYALLLLGYHALAAWMAGRAKAVPVALPADPAGGAEAPTVPLGTGTERAHPAADQRSSPYSFAKLAVNRWSSPAVQAAGGLVLFALLLVYAYEPARLDRAAYIEMIDVGQGDALLIRTPEGRHILNDGGGTVRFSRPGEAWRERKEPYEVGRKLLVPLLKKRGVQQIDLLIVSHLDTDHIGGLTAVLEDIPVKRLLWNGSIRDAAEVKMMFAAAAARDVPVYPACAPQIWEPEAHVKVEVLWPPAAGTAGCDGDVTSLPLVQEQNEYSVVTMLELYGHRLLLTGDIGAPTERLLLERLELRDEAPDSGDPYASSGGRRADIVKIAHHGSRHSTTEEWLAYWQPSVALIPVGLTNWYGHPHPTVMERLSRRGLQVLRTDRDGGVMLRITEKGIEHRTKIQQ